MKQADRKLKKEVNQQVIRKIAAWKLQIFRNIGRRFVKAV